jgi:hypothetical protein
MAPRLYSAIAPHARLSVISRHLGPRQLLPLNTPYSTDRLSSPESTVARPRRFSSSLEKPKMSSQPNHPALLIPGPIEFDDAVLQSMSHYRYVMRNVNQMPLFSTPVSAVESRLMRFALLVKVMLAPLSSTPLERPFLCFENSSKLPILPRSPSLFLVRVHLAGI